MKGTFCVAAILLIVQADCLSLEFAATASPLNALSESVLWVLKFRCWTFDVFNLILTFQTENAGESSFTTSCDANEKCNYYTEKKLVLKFWLFHDQGDQVPTPQYVCL